MTPREIIKRNLEFTNPTRIGLNFGDNRRNDFVGAGIGPSLTWKQRTWVEGNLEFSDDEWGNVWHRVVGMSQRGEIYQPALQQWSDLDNYQLPDFDNPARYLEAAQVFAQDTSHYRIAALPGFPFAICRYLRKMEIYFEDLLLERPRIDELHQRVTDLLEGIINRIADTGADGIIFCEDWGTQERLLVSPAMWREIFKPLFRRLCAAAHDRGLHVLMHSCGYNWHILDDLAEVGVNAFQFDQPELYGLERLAQKLQHLKVCLHSPVDIQKIMPTGDQTLIVDSARAMVRLFGAQHGGLIAKNYPDLPGIGVKEQWDQWAYDAFEKAKQLPAR